MHNLIDTHVHLHDKKYDKDRHDVIQRAFDFGVEKIITIGTDEEESQNAINLAEEYNNIYATVGLHPNELCEHLEEKEKKSLHQESRNGLFKKIEIVLKKIEVLAHHEKVVAIGECGLDYFNHKTGLVECSEEEKQYQKYGFIGQVKIAQRLNLPLVIHCRDAYYDLLDIIKEENLEKNILYIIMHCYMADTEVTKKMLEIKNVLFSFSGNITYSVKKINENTKNDLTETVKMIPLDRILTETDGPYLTPKTHRGTRNESCYMLETVEKIAELKKISIDDVSIQTVQNAKKYFGLV